MLTQLSRRFLPCFIFARNVMQRSLLPESVTSLHHIAQALDSTAVRKMPAEPTGAAKIFQFHRKTNILHSIFTLKSRIQVLVIFGTI
ncbi:MAG: hypothetical protein OFPII_09790 [Osedax symbiont Rs1]|nr:MAG: hypothetical protein OFPII_09790 [Osedax symbiont Rs1]